MTTAVLAWDVGLKNLSFCVYARDHNILAWDDLDTSIRRGTSLSCTVKKLTEFLDEFCTTERFQTVRGRITHCVIENQPKRNPTMRVVSGIIGTYFLIKFGWTPLYFNPAHKLAGVDIGAAMEFGQKTRKRRWGTKEAASAYRMRKRASIEETRRLLQTDARFRDWLVFFERHRKKDDLGDTLLMARAFLHAPNVVEPDDSDSSSDEGEEESDDEPVQFEIETEGPVCVRAEFIRTHPRPSKSKSATNDSVEYFKYILEDRLHKEYGSNLSLKNAVEKVMKHSKAKGVRDFRDFLATKPCACERCNWVTWLLYEPHWATMFSSTS